jgi:PAS domain-containing protein
MLLTSFIERREIPAYAGMTKKAGHRQKSGAACYWVPTFVGLMIAAPLFFRSGKFVIPAQAGICQIKLDGIDTNKRNRRLQSSDCNNKELAQTSDTVPTIIWFQTIRNEITRYNRALTDITRYNRALTACELPANCELGTANQFRIIIN